ncbi:CdaR family transcriptional regulator [Terracoccus luteus]|uniref:CdaR family transcriptional regulator n=1 Tax=Terracoccus luteus TaxID=53356 RepID=A0A495XZG1_9MICO|nr:PucR family transcriptional regulator ligand-binding domain-containing protein [Terracoccus luteus]RKT80000.1 CdaR family transcriptional regulator [Terracoccus luteus]
MPMPVSEVLCDPTIRAAEPVVLAGQAGLDNAVTWVHTSEVLDIAPLLRGGELLLVGGVGLADASPTQRARYVRELAERGASGIAIETGARLRRVPPEMVEEAERVSLPLVQLRRVVRFIEVTQAVNGLLVNESVRRLQLADEVSHALALALARGAELPELMAVLAERTQADARLTAPDGELLAEAAAPALGVGSFSTAEADDPAGDPADDVVTGPSTAAPVGMPPVVAPVDSAGVTVALLTLTPRPGANLLVLDAALDRAPEALGLAMLRFRPLSRRQRDTHELFELARAGERASTRRLREVATRLGLAGHDAWVVTVARIGPGPSLATGIEAAVGRTGRTLVSEVDRHVHTCVVGLSLGGRSLEQARQDVVTELRSVALPAHVTVAVGPGARSVERLPHTLAEAEGTLALTDESHQVVADSVALGITRLVTAVDRDDLLQAFVDEQIGDLLALDRDRAGSLFETLALYLRHSANKTETAARLHVQRQSLYQRLERIMAVLGHPQPGTSRWAAIALAVELETARRTVAGEVRGFGGLDAADRRATRRARRPAD